MVSGKPLVRPWWWFDPDISGEAMADVGTHLADLALWLIAPEQLVDHATQIQVLAADRCPLLLSEDQFRAVTGLPGYPEPLRPRVVNGELYYAGNNSATFRLGDIHVRLSTVWEYESAPGGGDTHVSAARGTRAVVEVRQEPGARPEVFVRATDPADHAAMWKRLGEVCECWAPEFPGVSATDLGTEARVLIPDRLRTGHEDHFAAVMEEYVRYFQSPRAVPAWERPNALARYYITTKAVELARATG